ncbi:MAG: exonuclease SbcCD subunit D [Desulfitobacterium sp.]
MKKFIICGDLHFRSEKPRNRKDNFEEAMVQKLKEVFGLAYELSADVIIPGDIFDTANVSLKTIAELGSIISESGVQVLAISGNHDLPAGNKAALARTPFGLLEKLGIVWNIEDECFEIFNMGDLRIYVTGCGFDFQTDTPEGMKQFKSDDASDEDELSIHVVHSMLLAASPSFPMRHTIIDQVETDADIIISGHYHEGFGIHRRKDGKLFINPGALCRLSASEAEMKRTVQVALLTIRSKTDFDAELIPLQSARPAEEVLDREAIVDKKEHDNWLESFFESLSHEGEAKFMEVREIVDNIASRENVKPEVKDEALRRIGDAREKLGRVAV